MNRLSPAFGLRYSLRSPSQPGVCNGTRLGRRPMRGLSFVEALVAGAVSLAALGSSVPGFAGLRERTQIQGLAEQVQGDIQHARSLAVAQNRVLRMSFIEDAAGTCYVLHSGSANACSCNASGNTCSASAQAFGGHWTPASQGVAVRANVRSMAFEPLRGTVTPSGTVKVTGRSGKAVHVAVNIMGRVRHCSPEGSQTGHSRC